MKKVETEEEIKTKGKMVAITTIVSFIVVVGFIFYLFSSIRSCAKDSNKRTYYILEVNEENKSEIIDLLKSENRKYCESINKIQYSRFFTKGYDVYLYCSNEENINFTIRNEESRKLIDYINEKGIIERR